MTDITVVSLIKLKKGEGVLHCPPHLSKDSLKSRLRIHGIYNSNTSPLTYSDLCTVTTNASTFVNHNSQFKANILGVFQPPPARKYQTFQADIWAPLNFLPDELEFRIVDADNQLIQMDGHLLVELKGLLNDPIFL